MATPAPTRIWSGTANLNGTCYGTDDFNSLVQVGGDAFTIFTSYIGGTITLICFLVFLYFAFKTKGAFAIILALCCASSLITSIVKYFQAKNDINNLETSGKIQKIKC